MIYETTIPALENSSQTPAWLPQPQLHQKRPRHSAQSPPCWSQTPHACLNPETPARRRFTQSQRIKQGRDFAHIRQEGQRLVNGCLIANFRRLPPESTARLGVITSRKVGGAVVRNRARRLLREAFRLHQHELAQSLDLVLVARPVISGKTFGQVEKDFLTTLRKAGLLK